MKEDKIIRYKQLKEYVPVAHSTIFLWSKEGKFPKALQLGPRSIGWRMSEVQAWIKAQQAQP